MTIITLLAKASFWLLHEQPERSHHKGSINQSEADLRKNMAYGKNGFYSFSVIMLKEKKIDEAENAIRSYFTFMVSYS